MEIDRFDALTRTLSTAESRRCTLRALGGTLFGGVLGNVAATLGIGEDAAAKGKKHRKGHDDQKRSGQVQAAGKKHKKHNHKHHNKPGQPPPLPPGCEHCGTCEMCQDGACVPDPDLNGVRCLDDAEDPGGQCHVCQSGTCVRDPHKCCADEKPCPDKSCVLATECCPGERHCAGDVCIPDTGCCPEQKECEYLCLAQDECCPEDPQPSCSTCNEVVCDQGSWACRGTVVQCQEGCCPEGYWCHHLGSCCNDAGHCTCPSGYHPVNGICVPS